MTPRPLRALSAVVLGAAAGTDPPAPPPAPRARGPAALVLLSLLSIPGSELFGIELSHAFQVVPLLGGALLLRTRAMRWLLLAVLVSVSSTSSPTACRWPAPAPWP
jgi:hypothetical protein